MRTINATLPKEMPPVGVEMELKSYHAISTVENKDDHEVDDEPSSSILTTLKKSIVVKLSAAIFIVIACMLLVVSRGRSNGHAIKSGEMQSVNDAAWMGGASVGTTYCKTSCTSQCSSYFSVYGPLCCDWAEGNLSVRCIHYLQKDRFFLFAFEYTSHNVNNSIHKW
jgi:hypothetical protein